MYRVTKKTHEQCLSIRWFHHIVQVLVGANKPNGLLRPSTKYGRNCI